MSLNRSRLGSGVIQQHAPKMANTHSHSAWIFWSSERAARGLPSLSRVIAPAWFDDAPPGPDEGWSLVCDFAQPSADQGDPSTAQVRFLVAGAPHARLCPGVRLRIFERETQRYATVDILD